LNSKLKAAQTSATNPIVEVADSRSASKRAERIVPNEYDPHEYIPIGDLIDVVVDGWPSQNFDKDKGRILLTTFRFNEAIHSMEHGETDYEISLDSCRLEISLSTAEVRDPEYEKICTDDRSRKQLKLRQVSAYPSPKNPKWRMEANTAGAQLLGNFEKIELCEVVGVVNSDDTLSVQISPAHTTIKKDGREIKKKTVRDKVFYHFLRLRLRGRPTSDGLLNVLVMRLLPGGNNQ
jgi:hypothetical protein